MKFKIVEDTSNLTPMALDDVKKYMEEQDIGFRFAKRLDNEITKRCWILSDGTFMMCPRLKVDDPNAMHDGHDASVDMVVAELEFGGFKLPKPVPDIFKVKCNGEEGHYIYLPKANPGNAVIYAINDWLESFHKMCGYPSKNIVGINFSKSAVAKYDDKEKADYFTVDLGTEELKDIIAKIRRWYNSHQSLNEDLSEDDKKLYY